MFVLVGMQDDGLLILPTHRLIGGISGRFQRVEASRRSVDRQRGADGSRRLSPPERMTEVVESLSHDPPNMFALYDGKSKRIYHVRIDQQ